METEGVKRKEKLRSNETAPERVKRAQKTEYMRNGREFPDPTPIAPPVGFLKQPTMAETMRQMIRSHELRMAARESGQETFEEADDFDVGDDYDPRSPYEEEFEPPVVETQEERDARFVDTLSKGLRKAFAPEESKLSLTPEPESNSDQVTPEPENNSNAYAGLAGLFRKPSA